LIVKAENIAGNPIALVIVFAEGQTIISVCACANQPSDSGSGIYTAAMFSRMRPIRQYIPDRSIADLPGVVRMRLDSSEFSSKPKRGGRIAIGVGSRGIAHIATIVRSAVTYWNDGGYKPFIFPAMGSHGAATAEGQAQVLARYGIDEGTMDCPILSSLEVVSLGRTHDGIEVFMDRNAYCSEGVMLIGRVKWHTDFDGKLESGLFKMMAIGLGKFAGARQYHAFAHNAGLEHVIRTVGHQVLSSGKIIGGLAVVEDGLHNTAHVEAVPINVMEQREEELLSLAKSWKARIPVDHLDLLIVDEIGKNIMGSGMDTKVVNRSVHGAYNPWKDAGTRIERILVRDLNDITHGNAAGIGLADVIHDRVLAKVDWNMTWVNVLTGSVPAAGRMPIHFATDRECIEKVAPTAGRVDNKDVTIGWIWNTLELTTLMLSENLREQIEANPNLEIIGPAQDFCYDQSGNLPAMLDAAGVPTRLSRATG
jgi:hypothetical protein